MSSKNPYPVEFSANSLTTHINLNCFRSILLVRTIILKKIYLIFGVLAAFYKFHWISKVYATLTTGNRFPSLGCRFQSLRTLTCLTLQFLVKAHSSSPIPGTEYSVWPECLVCSGYVLWSVGAAPDWCWTSGEEVYYLWSNAAASMSSSVPKSPQKDKFVAQ